jgi:hypothetical protein
MLSNTESNQIGSIPIVILLVQKIIVLLCVIGNCVFVCQKQRSKFCNWFRDFFIYVKQENYFGNFLANKERISYPYFSD